jgi:hypothetical protein
MRSSSSEESCVHGSRGHIGNCKSRALASNLKNPMNYFFLSSFAKCPAKQKLWSTLLTSFLSPRSRNALLPLVWTHLYWVSAPQLPLSFPFLSFPFSFVSFHTCCKSDGRRWGCVYNLEKQNTHEREREREIAAGCFQREQPSLSRGMQVYLDIAQQVRTTKRNSHHQDTYPGR